MGYSVLESGPEHRVRPYPLLHRHNYYKSQLKATLTITITLTVGLSLLIGSQWPLIG